MLLEIILWFGLFLDVLESFSPLAPSIKSSSIISTTRISIILKSELDHVGSTSLGTTTFVLPAFNHTCSADYPSPLHKIHVETLMTREEASTCCSISQEFAQQTGKWNAPDSERHESYATCDFPVEDSEKLEGFLHDIGFQDKLFSKLGELYTLKKGDLSFLDLFVAHYKAKGPDGDDDSSVMDRLDLHRDGTLLSFSLLLNSENDFTGGGTFYDGLRDVETNGILQKGGVIRPNQGDAVLHCGKILHGADVVTKGERTVLVGFVEVAEYCTRKGAMGRAATDFGRMDVATRRLQRQRKMGNKSWKLQNGKFLTGHSHLQRIAPVFDSVIRRGDPEYQRQFKLEAEDTLLRSVLLPEEERAVDPLFQEFSVL
ncbi:unnamed protein product [Cylindrotheca closterium]|uniref:Fe2OG dioxygenase domain-containing protein n=1 Tax=Cylindrotheca closterium TaxID=2856 RepID=A0AAD2CEK6_9STRA|nr:unnamed protein product [Cylindrotheca closterium]